MDSYQSAYARIFSFVKNHTGSVINDTQDTRSHIVSLISNHIKQVSNGTIFDVMESVDHILSYISNHKESMMNDSRIEDVNTSFERLLSLWSQAAACVLYTNVTDIIIYAICGLGIIANIVAFHVFGKMGHKNSSTLLLRALAVMDSLFLVFSILTMKTSAQNYYTISTLYFRPVRSTSQIFAVWTSILLGINRYLVVCRPFMAPRWCTLGIARKQLAIVVCLAIIYVLPRFFAIESIQAIGGPQDKNLSITFKPWANSYYYNIIYREASFMLLVFIVPLLLQLLFSIRLGVALRNARRMRQEMGASMHNGDQYATRLVLGILIVFIVCYIPFAVNKVLWMVHDENMTRCGFFLYYYRAISRIFVVLNSSVNCLIYIIFNPHFRETLHKGMFTLTRRMSKTVAQPGVSEPHQNVSDHVKIQSRFRSSLSETFVIRL